MNYYITDFAAQALARKWSSKADSKVYWNLKSLKNKNKSEIWDLYLSVAATVSASFHTTNHFQI